VKPTIEYWFDFSCPFAYLGSVGIEAMGKRINAAVELKPMLLGGVFRARTVPQNLAASVGESKARFNLNDMRRYATYWEVPFQMPNGHPLRTVNALRALLAAGEPFNKLMHAFYHAYWVEGLDISADDQIRYVLVRAGYDADPIMKQIRTDKIKKDLFARTEEAISKGVFGAPAMIVDGGLYWGQDRMDMVESLISGRMKQLQTSVETICPVDFYFDFASPFAFLAMKRVQNLFGKSLRFRPMFLGGLWREVNPRALISNPDDTKNAYLGADFRRQAKEQGTEHKWPAVFPVKTTLALRVSLLCNNDPALIEAIFDAYWQDGLDISQPRVVQGICDRLGMDGAQLVFRAEQAEAKNRLREATQIAIDVGVFGAPTMLVHIEDAAPALYWGNDRLWMAALAARGDRRVL
jgi:2-hydroxychromene-2-carboxylate isomerase